MTARRIEITVCEGTWDALNVARGHEPRASFVKRALESALDETPRSPEVLKALRDSWDSPALEEQFVADDLPAKPKPIPGVRRGSSVESDGMRRQRLMNKAKGL